MRARLRRPAREAAIVLLLYAAYTTVRNLLGDDTSVALRNAERVVDLERSIGVFHERTVQQALDIDALMELLNAFYGIAHFAVTIGVLVWLYRSRRTYAVWRTALAATTFLALIGYVLFPLAPPRLVPELGIVDSLVVHGSPWSYEHGAISELSNQYAAMPSLHMAWALWCTIALWEEAAGSTPRRVLVRAGAVLYSVAALIAIVATGNHFVLDAVGGALVLAGGLMVARRTGRWRSARAARAGRGSEAVVAAVDGDDVSGVVAARRAGEVDREAAEVLR